MRVALVYDRVNKIGGAERVLVALHELFPDAPLYTALYAPKSAPWAKIFTVNPSFINRLPFARRHHELLPWAMPFAFESFTFDAYDVVISITSESAKTIVTKPETQHICYCLTPTRYLWSGEKEYMRKAGFGFLEPFAQKVFTSLSPLLKQWDMVGSSRPDMYIAISKHVKDRIEKYYKRKVEKVIYPPVDTLVFHPSPKIKRKDYYLFISRLVPYKRADIVVDACTKLGVPLIVIGDGVEKKHLMKRAGPTIQFINGNLTDKDIVSYHQQCRAFLYAGNEDFGLVAAESMACGTPVVAYKESGMKEIVEDGKTGVLFEEQTVTSLIEAIKKSQTMHFDTKACQRKAEKFSKNQFKKDFLSFVAKNTYNTL